MPFRKEFEKFSCLKLHFHHCTSQVVIRGFKKLLLQTLVRKKREINSSTQSTVGTHICILIV